MFEQLSPYFPTDTLRHAVLIAGILLTLRAAMTDLTRFTISNRICTALFALGGVWILMNGASPWPYLAGFAGVLGLGFIAYAFRLFGAGDAKLLAALALWIGFPGVIGLVFTTALFGAILALLWVLSRPLRLALMAVGLPIDPEPPAQIPYGLAIAAAALIAFADLWAVIGS